MSDSNSRGASVSAATEDQNVPWRDSYTVALMIVSTFAPFILTALVSGAIVYEIEGNFDEDPEQNKLVSALLWGTAAGLLLWFVVLPILLGWLMPDLATNKGGNRVSAESLVNRLETLKSDVADMDDPDFEPRTPQRLALEKARHLQEQTSRSLSSTGRQWMLGTGYVQAWRSLQRAENQLMMVAPLGTLSHDAIDSYLRLAGSNIPNAARVLKLLGAATYPLFPELRSTIDEQSSHGRSRSDTPEDPEMSLRVALLTARDAIGDYRTDQWSKVLNIRNRLILTTVLVQIGLYGLLVAAFVGNKTNLTVPFIGLTYFMIGAVLGGLYGRLREAMESESAVDDYGLSTARLVATPVFSGVAAVIGIGMVEVLADPGQSNTAKFFDAIYRGTPYHYLQAILFGLIPAEVLHRLELAKTQLMNIEQSQLAEGESATSD